jgi:hypothetical protein
MQGNDDFSDGGADSSVRDGVRSPNDGRCGVGRGLAVVITSLRSCRWHTMALASMAEGEMARRAASMVRNLLGTLWLRWSTGLL